MAPNKLLMNVLGGLVYSLIDLVNRTYLIKQLLYLLHQLNVSQTTKNKVSEQNCLILNLSFTKKELQSDDFEI